MKSFADIVKAFVDAERYGLAFGVVVVAALAFVIAMVAITIVVMLKPDLALPATGSVIGAKAVKSVWRTVVGHYLG